MKKIKKIIYISSAVYVVLGIIFFAINNFSIHKSVDRYQMDSACGDVKSFPETRANRCFQTLENNGSGHVTWVGRQFFSKYMGKDEATYFPADLIVLFLLNGSLILHSKTLSKKKNTP